MLNSSIKLKYLIFGLAACVSVLAAMIFAIFIETISKNQLKSALEKAEYSWAKIDPDGLQLFIHGNAPTDSERIGAIEVARSIVAPKRLIDNIFVEDRTNTKQKVLNLKILKSMDRVLIIGTFPTEFGPFEFEEILKKRLSPSDDYDIIADQTELVPPVNWEAITLYAVSLLDIIKIGKIETDGNQLLFEGIASDNRYKRNLKEYIKSRAPPNLPVEISLHQPRELISPFTFQVEIKNGLLKYSNCVVGDEKSKGQIIKMAKKLDAMALEECLVGLGEPSPQWTKALEKAFSVSAQLVNAKVIFDNLNVSIILDHSFSKKEYSEIITSISNTFPPEFVLSLVKLSNDDNNNLSSNKVVATLSPEGLVKIVGPVSESFDEALIANFAKARFGSEQASTSLYNVASLPTGWGFRIIAGLEGLHELKNGILEITPNLIEIKGTTQQQFSSAKITKIIGDKIGYNQRLSIEIDYVARPEPVDNSLTARQCVDKINNVLQSRKINFEPSSDRVDLTGQKILDDIAKILFNCSDIILEIGGHTDSQGREQMNLSLSQARANAVLFELQRRRILTKNIVAKGYGETRPIASNGTEQGREQNRRIEFKHIDLSLDANVSSED
jgi:OOP family OmpA-OmpF porin